MNNHYALILCGGSGTRLWPLSRTLRPKQLLALNGEETLLQQTAKRLLAHVPAQHLYTVTHEDHKFEVKGQLAEVAPEAVVNVLAEPCARNTLPAIAWAVNQIQQRDKDAIIGVFASDHAIDNQTAFIEAWQTAETIAEQDYLVLLGIKPDAPATGYGYIQPSKQIANGNMPVFEVAQFVEKPDADNNVMHGDVFAQDTTNSLLWNQAGVLATLGIDNVVVIQTADATLVCDKNRTEEIKSLVARIKEKSAFNEHFLQSKFDNGLKMANSKALEKGIIE